MYNTSSNRKVLFKSSINRQLALLAFLLWTVLNSSLYGQEENIKIQEDLIESLIENLESDDELDYNTLYEDLEYYLVRPLNLNTASEVNLKESRLFNDIQISQFLLHRTKYGKLISIHELQSIPAFDLKTIKSLEAFVSLDSDIDDYQIPLLNMLKEGKSELYFKWRRVLEEQIGYIKEFEDGGYEGDPSKLYMRYKYYHENRFRIGIVAEKDGGESFFSNSNSKGFDYYSGHIHLKNYNKTIKDIVIGDYTIGLGQGLILHNGFGAGKSAYVMNIKKGGRVIKSYNSINESNFYRGIAATIGIGKHISWSIFGSHKDIDGTFSNEVVDIGFESVSSIITDGFHRTFNEISKKDTLKQSSLGSVIKYESEKFRIAINGLYEKYSVPLIKDQTLTNLFKFNGDKLNNLSIDYSYRWQNIHFFGESAWSDNNALAHSHGILMGLDKKVDLGFLYRDFDVDYHSLNSNSFAETTGTSNEQGVYSSLILRPIRNWTISAYFDMWKHPWLRNSRDAPSDGLEYLLRLNYYIKRKFDFYIQYKYESKQKNLPIDELVNDKLGQETLHRLRIHFNHKVSKNLSLRNRLEMSFFSDIEKNSNGYMLFQDILYKPIASSFSFTARYAIFDIYDGDSRIYAYENDLIYEFFIPQFSGRGRRYYVNFRYDISRNITAEFRYSKTIQDFKRDADGDPIKDITIGSGGEKIEGNQRTELKAQLRFRF